MSKPFSISDWHEKHKMKKELCQTCKCFEGKIPCSPSIDKLNYNFVSSDPKIWCYTYQRKI